MFQTTSIAAIAMIGHIKSDDYWLFDGSSKNQIYFALLLSLLTLPLPGFMQEYLHARVLTRKLPQPKKSSNFDYGTKQKAKKQVYLEDAAMHQKTAIVSTAFVFYMVVLLMLCSFYRWGHDSSSFFRCTPEQAHAFVVTYYLAVVVFGWLVLNFWIRSWVIANVAPRAAQELLKEW